MQQEIEQIEQIKAKPEDRLFALRQQLAAVRGQIGVFQAILKNRHKIKADLSAGIFFRNSYIFDDTITDMWREKLTGYAEKARAISNLIDVVAKPIKTRPLSAAAEVEGFAAAA